VSHYPKPCFSLVCVICVSVGMFCVQISREADVVGLQQNVSLPFLAIGFLWVFVGFYCWLQE
jgi:hypothetical protein